MIWQKCHSIINSCDFIAKCNFHSRWRPSYKMTTILNQYVANGFYQKSNLQGVCANSSASFQKWTILLKFAVICSARKCTLVLTTQVDCFQSLTQPWRQAIHKGCKGTVSCPWKTVENSTGDVSPKCTATHDNPNIYFDQPIIKGWCQPVEGHVSNPTDSPPATRLGLCSSLLHRAFLRYNPCVSEYVLHQPCLSQSALEPEIERDCHDVFKTRVDSIPRGGNPTERNTLLCR